MSKPSDSRRISVRGAVALGVGSMVGAGIFALMGVAAAKAGSGVWLSFLVAGIIALLTGHSFVHLGVRYPSRGGIVEYLVRAYGAGRFSGGCSIFRMEYTYLITFSEMMGLLSSRMVVLVLEECRRR